MTVAEAVVQRQLDAYNARHLERFVACYADDIRVFRMPSSEPAMSGIAALTEYYATERFNLPGLHADLVHRTVLGDKVIDHERIRGVREHPFEAVVVYEVTDDLIRRVWMFTAA